MVKNPVWETQEMQVWSLGGEDSQSEGNDYPLQYSCLENSMEPPVSQFVLWHKKGVTLCSKSFKLGFSSTWSKSFQMYKLGLEKAEETEIKLPTFVGSYRKQGNSRKSSTSASLTMLKCLTVAIWLITTNCGRILKDMGISDHFTSLVGNLYAGQKAAESEVGIME